MYTRFVPAALTIAGSDPSGGAGLQADLRTFHDIGHHPGVQGQSVVTLVTVQDRRQVYRVEVLGADLVREQIEAVVRDQPPAAAKTGALGNASVVEVVANFPFPCPLVVDPVMISSRGTPLLDAAGREALVRLLVPKAFLLMPNLAEAEALCGFAVADLAAMGRACQALRGLGARNVLVKGGHLTGDPIDLLLDENGTWYEVGSARVALAETHGTGCVYSAAITAGLALRKPLPEAVGDAKNHVFDWLQRL